MASAVKIVVVMLLIFFGCASEPTNQGYNPRASVSLQLFYDELGPYGRWMYYTPYGYVWMPYADFGFSPYYTNGNWIYTSFGWTWHSYYPWGWAAFHYGRWFHDPLYGWMWMPDTIWAPAWVAWSTSGGYCGWAPLAPGVSVTVLLSGKHYIPHQHWVFVRDRDLSRKHIDWVAVDRSKNRIILDKALLVRNERSYNRVKYIAGPDRNLIQKASGKTIPTVGVQERTKPGNSRVRNNELEIFKPKIESKNLQAREPAPRNVYRGRNWQRERVDHSLIPGRENQFKRENDHRKDIQPNVLKQPQRIILDRDQKGSHGQRGKKGKD